MRKMKRCGGISLMTLLIGNQINLIYLFSLNKSILMLSIMKNGMSLYIGLKLIELKDSKNI